MSKRSIATRASSWSVPKLNEWDYSAFDIIDGTHPWQNAVPEGCVLYPVRKLNRGQVLWFNFELAKEMGLLPTDHPHKMTPELDKKIIETFSLQIVNEWDQEHGPAIPPAHLKANKYMATRYLQLQHADKRGRTSGDGRGIWNGTIRHRGITWDVSSRGTGVTRLSPGAVEAQRPLKTGTEEFGYGCGLADTTELIGSAVFSEIFYRNGMSTERVLAVIDSGRGVGIGVRAAPNLLRPAHLFLWLKQGQKDVLRRGVDQLINRQVENEVWNFSARSPDRYRLMLKEIALSFARFAALLERRYIFAWLDWDGDNVLADAGIIDYGSIRQFGLRHDQYRYDDVQRFSTNLNEQRGKARFTVQVFAQLVDFLETGRRRSLKAYDTSEAARLYDREFDRAIRQEFLEQIGFNAETAQTLVKSKRKAVEELYSSFLALETMKTSAGIKKLPDGVNRPAIFNMRRVLRELPEIVYTDSKSWVKPTTDVMIELMKSSFAKRADLRVRGALAQKIGRFTTAYMSFLSDTLGNRPHAQTLKSFKARARSKNREGRITGNGSEYLVEEIMKARKRGLSLEDLRHAVELYISAQSPERDPRSKPMAVSTATGQLLSVLTNLSLEHEEDI
ncbi:MAG: hypothetical protein JNJ49_01415 [Bdellovibrionaceae bacterium]|nr:hypothetical protein [Pseudobdellovibrionaceae bacterium]